MLDHIQHISVLDMEHNLLEAYATSVFQEFILFVVPIKIAHSSDDSMMCA
jgi:hypothetical protein